MNAQRYGYGASLAGHTDPNNTSPEDLDAALYGYAMAEELFLYGDRTGNGLPEEQTNRITNYNNIVMSSSPNDLYCSGGKMMIEEGTKLATLDGLRLHTVAESDRNIRITNGRNTSFFEVVKKPPPTPKTPTVLVGPTGGRVEIAPLDIDISDFTLLLSDDYRWSSVNRIPAYLTNVYIGLRGLSNHRQSRGCPVDHLTSAEQTAAETLREMVSEEEFRKFLRYGFVMVKGASGRFYQVFRNGCHTKVWKNGKVVEEVCVRIKDHNIPLTDNILAFKTIIEASEDEFRSMGNVYNMVGRAA